MELNCSIELIVDCGEGYDDQRVVKLAYVSIVSARATMSYCPFSTIVFI